MGFRLMSFPSTLKSLQPIANQRRLLIHHALTAFIHPLLKGSADFVVFTAEKRGHAIDQVIVIFVAYRFSTWPATFANIKKDAGTGTIPKNRIAASADREDLKKKPKSFANRSG